MSSALAALAAILVLAALRELAAGHTAEIRRAGRRAATRLSGGRAESAARLVRELGLSARLVRAGLDERLDAPRVLAAKAVAASLGAGFAFLVAPAAPARLGVVVALGLPAAGFFIPDALLERRAANRRRQVSAALPEALDMIGVAVGGGRSPVRALEGLARGTSGELSRELALCVAEIECGVPQQQALDRLRTRVGGAGIGGLVAALERSRRFGTPLAPQLRDQASALRAGQRRELQERASRAAPKIQLAVALLLVPSVLLLIGAALLAHSESLLPMV